MPTIKVDIHGHGRELDTLGTREHYFCRAYEIEGDHANSDSIVKAKFITPMNNKTPKELAEDFRLNAEKLVTDQLAKVAASKKAKVGKEDK